MSRSVRKTPVFGHTTSTSEKDDKKEWHSAFRSKSKQHLNVAVMDDEGLEGFIDITVQDASDTWDFAKDGKQFFIATDIEEHNKNMRK